MGRFFKSGMVTLLLLSTTACSSGGSKEPVDFRSKFGYDGDSPQVTVASGTTTQVEPTVSSDFSKIEAEAAKQIALRRANLKEEDVQGMTCQLIEVNGTSQYHISFWSGITEYLYQLMALDGSVVGNSTVFHDAPYTAPPVEILPEAETKPEESESSGEAGETVEQAPTTTAGNLSESEVKTLLAKEAGLLEGEMLQFKLLEVLNGSIPQYNVTFSTTTAHYSYEVVASTGTIFKSTKEDIEEEEILGEAETAPPS